MDKVGRPSGHGARGVPASQKHEETGSITSSAERVEPETVDADRPRPTRWGSVVAAAVASFGGWLLAWLLTWLVLDRGRGPIPVVSFLVWVGAGSTATFLSFKYRHSGPVRVAAITTLVCAVLALAAVAAVLSFLSTIVAECCLPR